MRALKEIENAQPTPEQLLLILDSQLSTQRSHRASSSRNRAMVLVAGVLFIVVAAGAALLVLDQMLGELRHRGAPAAEETTGLHGNF